MSRTALFISLSGFALSAIPENFRSPLIYDDKGWLVSYSNGTDGTSIHHLRVRLTSGSLNMITETVENNLVSENIFFEKVSDPSSIYILDVPEPIFTGYSAESPHSYIGIGFDSRVTQNTGSVAVIRNTTSAELVFGATGEFFNSACIPGSIMTFNSSGTGQFAVQVTLRNEAVETSMGDYRMKFGSASGSSAQVPRLIWTRISDLILSSGIAPGSRPGMFTGCSQAAIATLPNIELTFGNGSRLVYFPEDYLELNQSEGNCRLRFSSNAEGPLIVEPLFLTHTNVRVTRENVWDICESAPIA